ncbi:MAG: chemotaxis protein CheW [Armatimonadetes bacterium]|nr:chemotaxis protein CheW [Armatimonadota bacterium]
MELELVEDQAKGQDCYVILHVENDNYAIQTEFVTELIRGRENRVIAVPNSPRGVLGITNHRGKVMPVIELRQVLGFNSYLNEVSEMREFIKGREQDHVSWLEELRRSAESGEKFTKALDPTQCAFGKWYEKVRVLGRDNQEITHGAATMTSLLDAFDAPHRRIHGIATEVLRKAGSGDLDGAKKMIDEAWNGDLAKMKDLFVKFVEAFEESRQPSMVIIQSTAGPYAMVVDGVQSVINTELEFEEVPPTLSSDNECVQQIFRINDRIHMTLDVDRIAKHCKGTILDAA